jgi:integrase
MKLNKNAVAALVTDKPDHVYWDDTLPGFGVRLRGQSKRWIIQYRVGSQQRRESLGDVPRVGLDDARRIARHRFAQIELGSDPAADKAKARAEAATARLTLGAVSDRYLDAKRDVMRPNSYRDTARYFTMHWLPLRGRALAAITRAEVAARLQEITKAHGRVAASRARANLSALYSWSLKEGLCEGNPVIATNDPGTGTKARERVLSDHELAAVWSACDADDDFSRIVRLLVLTGARRQEIGSVKWSEVDLDSGVLAIPGERTKNHRSLTLPLPPMTLDILRSTPRRRDYVFGDRGDGFSSWSTSTATLKVRLGASVAPWTLHDLRRTMRTGLGRIGVQPHVAELVIGHARRGVDAVYDRGRYEREIARALALWAEHLASIIDGKPSKVVTMPARGGR